MPYSAVRRLLPVALAAMTPFLYAADDGAKKLSVEQMEEFLKGAKIVQMKPISTGVTNSQRAKLADEMLQHDAHVQSIDEAKTVFQGERGVELNFRDSWKFNVAGYKLARILGIGDMVPPSVERSVGGQHAAVTWWIDNSMMEVDRKKKKIEAPDKDSWNREMYVVRVYDQLIDNTDRNLQNLLIDPSFHIWMIDHTRAFRTTTTLREKKNLVQCDRALLAKLRELKRSDLDTLKPYLTDLEIKGLLARRDKIVQFFDDEVKAKGEGAVLYDRPARDFPK
jgi:hypothetical protein